MDWLLKGPCAAALVVLMAQPAFAGDLNPATPVPPPSPPPPRAVRTSVPPPPILAPPAQAVPPELDFARPDPKVVQGVLPNGLRYAIYQRASHGRESVRLRVLAGSRDEGPSELGAAHYLEHMAFDGSRHFPGASVAKRFESAGVAGGHDQNAFTTYLHTTYVLDLPQVDASKLDLGFQWLRDVADGLDLDPRAVDRERGVVLSEYRLQLGPAGDAAHALEWFKLPNLLGPLRQPIGAEASIEALRASDLRGFYQRWYRPDRAILVAVGEAPAADIKARIEAAFDSWSNPRPAPPHPSDGLVGMARSRDVLTLTQPSLAPYALVCRIWNRPRPGPQSVASRRAELADGMAAEVLNRRLLALRRSDKPPFVGATVERLNDYDAANEICLTASPLDHDWAGALSTLETEARRFEAYGPTSAELKDVQLEVIGGLNHAVTSDAAAYPSPIGERLINAMTEGVTFDTPEEERRIEIAALMRLDGRALQAAFRRRWTDGAAPLIAIQTPEPVTRDQVEGRWLAAVAAPTPSAPVDETHAPWAYASFGAPGRVVERQELHDPDFVRLKFANGVVVNFKPSNLAKGEVRIRIRFGGGSLELPPESGYAAELAAGVLLEGGFGKNSSEDLIRACSGHSCNASLAVERWSFVLEGAVTTPQDLGLELQLLSALLSDPGFRPSMDLHIPTMSRAAYRAWTMSPATTADFALNDAELAPRVYVQPTLAEVVGYRHGDFERILRPALTKDALEVTIVGDLDEARAIAALQSTLGALPPRGPGDGIRPDNPRVRYPAQAPAPITVFHDGPRDRAQVLLSWPSFAWTPERIHEDRVMTLMAQMLQNAVMEEIRQKLGKTYTPSVGSQAFRGGDQGSVVVSVETTPDSARAVAAAVRALSLDFARGRIPTEALEQARKPFLENEAKARTDNAWWVETLDGSYAHPDRLSQSQTFGADLARITIDEVRVEAKRWLTSDPIVVYSLPCAGPGPCHRELEEAGAGAKAAAMR